MTELEFKILCKKYKLGDNFIITKNYFSNKKNIIGCNNNDNNYVIYSTNDLGIIHEICTLTEECYAFKFLYLILKNNIELQPEINKIKIKKIEHF